MASVEMVNWLLRKGTYCGTHKTVNTRDIYMECYCGARNKPIRREITKPQTAMVINFWFWGLLAYPELYCDWPVHNQHSWNFFRCSRFSEFDSNVITSLYSSFDKSVISFRRLSVKNNSWSMTWYAIHTYIHIYHI